MFNKKTVLGMGTLVIALSLSSGLMAHSKDRMQRLSQKLGLSETQQQQLEQVMGEQREKMRQQRMLLKQETSEKLSQVLTAEQYEQWQALKQKHQAKREGKGRHHKWHKDSE